MANVDLNEEARRWPAVAALAGILALVGCGDGGGNGGTGIGGNGGTGTGGVVSCTLGEQTPVGNLMLCEEASGLDATSASQFQAECMAPPTGADAGVAVDARFAHAPCSHVGALGGCRIQMGGVSATIWYYGVDSATTPTSSDIQSLCSSIGATFVAP